jgi:thiol peroxidase
MKVTLQGLTMNLSGEFIQKGVQAPDFSLVKNDLSRFKLADGAGKYLLLNIFPSLDTAVCATSVRKFNKMASEMENTLVLCISKDLPFAQSRFCTTEGLKNVIPLSDFHYSSTFAKDYGILITDGPMSGLLARCVVIISPEGKVVYTQMVSEITNEPDYDKALAALK